MIIDFFITLIIGLINILPSFSFDLSSFTSALNTFLNALTTINYYLPIRESFIILSLVLSFYAFRLVYRAICYIIELLPFT